MSGLSGSPDDVIELWTRNGPCKIALLSGDITQLPMSEMMDIIMVSAFPGDYAAISGTVIGALRTKLGISVLKLSDKKELDLRTFFSCWLSKPIEESGSPFKKLLCFERKRGSSLNIVAQISEMFRVFVPVFNNQDHTVITPLLATGNQGQSKAEVCEVMVDAAIQWINAGLPLRQFKIVIYDGIDHVLKSKFTALKRAHIAKNAEMKKRIFTKKFDVYISYNPDDQQYMNKIKQNLQQKKTDIKLHTDIKHFDENKVWQDEIFSIMVACKRIIAILSPAFMKSSECLEQYNMAMCCSRLLGVDVLAPFYIDTIKSLPSYMGLVQWIDCRVRKDGDTTETKIISACRNIVLAIEEHDSGDGNTAPVSATDKAESKEKFNFDVFISYSHKNPAHAEKLLESFNKLDPNLKVFYDRSALTTGSNWQNMLYECIGECRCFIALLSPTYLSSTICNEEYNLALARYLSKDKDLMLIPVCIEKLDSVPAHISIMKIADAFTDFDTSAAKLAQSIVKCLSLTDKNTPLQYTIQESVDLEKILSASRCEDVKNQYKVVSKEKEKPKVKRIQPLLIHAPKLEAIDMSSVDVAVSYANDAMHLAGSFCMLMDRLYPNLNISVHTHANQKRYSALDTARKIVIFVSKEFLGNEHHMQELHLALIRQRPLSENILYLVKTTHLSGRPFFPRILQYDVACTDSVWRDLEKTVLKGNHDPDSLKVTVFGKKSRLEHSSTFFCSNAEYFAITKVVEDVLESVLTESTDKKELGPMLLNVKSVDANNLEHLLAETGTKPTQKVETVPTPDKNTAENSEKVTMSHKNTTENFEKVHTTDDCEKVPTPDKTTTEISEKVTTPDKHTEKSEKVPKPDKKLVQQTTNKQTDDMGTSRSCSLL